MQYEDALFPLESRQSDRESLKRVAPAAHCQEKKRGSERITLLLGTSY